MAEVIVLLRTPGNRPLRSFQHGCHPTSDDKDVALLAGTADFRAFIKRACNEMFNVLTQTRYHPIPGSRRRAYNENLLFSNRPDLAPFVGDVRQLHAMLMPSTQQRFTHATKIMQ